MSARKVVLAIDDVSMNLLTIKGVLSDHFDVRVAKSGPLAMYILGNVKVDLILTDIEMPGMSGFDFINAIREIPDLKNIPIILVSSHAHSHYLSEAVQAGVTDFIVKPIKPKVMKEKIFKALDMPITEL